MKSPSYGIENLEDPALVAMMISYLGLSMKKHLTENV